VDDGSSVDAAPIKGDSATASHGDEIRAPSALMNEEIASARGLLSEKVDAITDQILELIDSGTPTPIILIDGRTGSGKTTFAAQLQNRLFQKGESAPRVIHMDDLYEGWDGLQAGVDYLIRQILNPLSRREGASWQEYDWAGGERSGSWREFRGGTPVIIEGCGSLSRIAAEQADVTIWLEADQGLRMERLANREDSAGGDTSWFAMWSAQEADFYAREKSDELANLVIKN
jgi:uridine kinase